MKSKNLLFIAVISLFISWSKLYGQETPQELPEGFENLIEDRIKEEVASNSQQVITTNELDIKKDISKESNKIFGLDFFNYVVDTNLPILDIPLSSDYLISFNDELEILLTGNINKIFNVRVDMSGNILIPEIGSTSLIGLTIEEANTKISVLAKNFYIGTKSYLSVKKPSLKKISVIGNVKNPGTYLVNPFITLTEAIKYASGFNDNSSLRNINVRSKNGVLKSYDLYDFLMFGDRRNDVNLNNGDTVIINATSEVVKISGQIQREMLYEYKNDDTYEDLLGFALGFKEYADINNINVNYLDNGVIKTEKINLNGVVGDKKILDIFIGEYKSISKKKLFINGLGTGSGFYDFEENQQLADIISKLNFSSDFFPFYAVLKQMSMSGMKSEFYSFSLADPQSYEGIILKDNPELIFFDRETILSLSNLFLNKLDQTSETNKNYLQDVRQSDLKLVFMGNKAYRVPLRGKLSPKLFYEYFGDISEISEDSVVVNLKNSSETAVYESIFNFDDVLSFSFPQQDNSTFKVSITGQVKNPGVYSVTAGTTLNDLYMIAGGLKQNSSSKGILFSRESVKVAQKKAIESSRQILTDALIAQASNPLNAKNADLDFNSILALSDMIEFSGRISGNFQPNSIESNSFYLEENDSIFVPYQLSTITVAGEVLNPITTTLDLSKSYRDYISFAGGFNEFADRNQIYVIKANGEAVPLDKNLFGKQIYPEPGDTIVVPRNLSKIDTIPLVSIATKIVSDIAFSAASINAIRN